MRIFIAFILVFSLTITTNAQENASCRDFTQEGVNILTENDFLPDGRFNSVKLSQDDRIEVYKPFYKGRNYMLIVSSEEILPGIIVEVKDISRKVIFSSDETNSIHKFNITPDKNQNLIISVQVVKSDEFDDSKQGCVSVIVGFQ